MVGEMLTEYFGAAKASGKINPANTPLYSRLGGIGDD